MNPTRAILALAAASVLSLGAVACGSDDESATSSAATDRTTEQTTTTGTGTTETQTTETTETTPPEKEEGTVIRLEGGKPDGGEADIELKSGDEGKITVESDEELEIHLHGYEIKKTVKPGEPAEFEFDADIPGVFTMEIENTGAQIAEIEVS